MTKSWIALVLLANILDAGCASKTGRIVSAIGPINLYLVKSVEDQIREFKTTGYRGPISLIISYSPGGRADALFSLERVVGENVSQIIVSGDCLSACAELLTMSGLPVIALKNPVIGFHVGPAVARELIRRSKFDVSGFPCINDRAKKYAQILSGKGVDAQRIANAVIDKIKFTNVRESSSNLGDGCRNVDFEAENRLWFPTGEQLRNIFGISVKGSVCADSLDCISDFAIKRWGTRKGVVVGDTSL